MAWLKKKNGASRDRLLSAGVVRNQLVRETRNERGLRLTAPLRRAGLREVLGAPRSEKSFELDALGAYVWSQIGACPTVEGLIRRFSDEKRVNLREAEVAILAFLKTMAQRNLIALAVPKEILSADTKPGR